MSLMRYAQLSATLPLAVSFFISGLCMNVVQGMLYVCVRPINKRIFRKLIYYCLYTVWIQLVFVAEYWSGSELVTHCTSEVWGVLGKEKTITIMNHSYELDWLMSWVCCEQARVLGCANALMKKTLQMVPIMGWSWKFAEGVFLERNWEKDKVNLEKQLRGLGAYEEPTWLFIFAEGTRYTRSKCEASVEFAKKNGLPIYENVLLPRTKGFVTVARVLRQDFDAVYSCTMVFNMKEGAEPTLANMLMGRKIAGEMYIKRTPLTDLPEDDDKTAKWLYDDFQEKDDLIKIYKEEGRFRFDDPAIVPHHKPRRWASLIHTAFWASITLPPVGKALASLIVSGGIWGNLLVVSLLASAVLALYKLVALSTISRASEYGKSKKKD